MGAAASSPSRGRHERKFLVAELEPQLVESLIRLHPALFREVYPPRRVNNIYLDSVDQQAYLDNLAGSAARTKVRIRWYGDLFGRIEKPVLEFKRKQGHLGRKQSFPLASFSLGSRFDLRALKTLMDASELPRWVRESVLPLRPNLVNGYTRKYFVSGDCQIRLTLDMDREFYRVGPRNNLFVSAWRDETTTILELKYSPEADERAAQISNRFPFRMTKSSKYVQGIEYSSCY